MNPFDLHGPEFLAFFALFATLVWLALLWTRLRHEPQGPATGRLNDPYRIAYLRGGDHEMRRVAAISLVDRGLLRAEAASLVAAPGADEAASDPLERAILAHFARPREARDLYDVPSVTAIGLGHHDALARQGLLPDTSVRAQRSRHAAIAIAVLLGVAGTKVAVALLRGRSNVILLLVLAAFAAFVAWRLGHPRLTRRGRQVLADLALLFGGVHHAGREVQPGGAAPDALVLAAVYGVGALATLPGFAYAHALFPRATRLGAASTASCGSSCGSSCGGGGSSCGGGGCGGCGS